MSNTKTPKNDNLLAIRIGSPLLQQLNALANAKGIGTSTMARMALIDYLKNQAPDALIGINPSAPLKSNGRPINPARAIYEAMSPSERKAYDDDWNY